jgi:hypothetical protein
MRVVTSKFRRAVEMVHADDLVVVFGTITHPDWASAILVNNDIHDYYFNGVLYYGTAFELSLVSDTEEPPQAQVSIPNVDQQIGEAILGLETSPKIKLEICLRSDWDNSSPRLPIATPVVEYTAPELLLRDITCTAVAVSATLHSFDLSTEPWPRIRTTPELTPGLYR